MQNYLKKSTNKKNPVSAQKPGSAVTLKQMTKISTGPRKGGMGSHTKQDAAVLFARKNSYNLKIILLSQIRYKNIV